MVTTDNPTFNSLLDQMLSPNDRRLMMVTPASGHSVGMITPDKNTIKTMEQVREIHANQLAAMDKLITLSKLASDLNVKIIEQD
jgi:hypothetical protein